MQRLQDKGYPWGWADHSLRPLRRLAMMVTMAMMVMMMVTTHLMFKQFHFNENVHSKTDENLDLQGTARSSG